MKSNIELYVEIMKKLDFDHDIDHYITINVNGGHVKLIGSVGSAFEKRLIQKVIANTEGVLRIINELIIDQHAKFRLSDVSIAHAEVSSMR